MSDKFSNARYFNQATPLLTYALNHIKEMDSNFIYLQLNKDFFDIVIIQDHKLTLYNSFLYVNSTDLLYFILYACKQLKVDTKTTAFVITGEHAQNESLIKELKIYIPKLYPVGKLVSLPLNKLLKPELRQRFLV